MTDTLANIILSLSSNVPTLLIFYLLYKDISNIALLTKRQDELIGKVTQLLDLLVDDIQKKSKKSTKNI